MDCSYLNTAHVVGRRVVQCRYQLCQALAELRTDGFSLLLLSHRLRVGSKVC